MLVLDFAPKEKKSNFLLKFCLLRVDLVKQRSNCHFCRRQSESQREILWLCRQRQIANVLLKLEFGHENRIFLGALYVSLF